VIYQISGVVLFDGKIKAARCGTVENLKKKRNADSYDSL